jgi:hypothetical protein
VSLEATIADNTAALRDLIAALAAQPVHEAQTALQYFQAKAIYAEPPLDNTPPSLAPVVTYDELKSAFLNQLVLKHGRDAGAQLLSNFGVAAGGKLSDIDASRWDEVAEAIKALSV